MAKIAVIKTGATGDVVRTTVLLHLFRNDEVTWVTARNNIQVLPAKQDNLVRTIAIEEAHDAPSLHEHYDLVISLDDDLICASLADRISKSELFGACTQAGRVVYTESANEWFDMGLSSRLGKAEADRLKLENQYSYQEILFRMLGHTFEGAPYLLPEDIIPVAGSRTIGIEARAGNRWPTKVWNQYPQLAEGFKAAGYDVVFFADRPSIRDYMEDISRVGLMISGDTLGMHVALGLKIPVVALFTCTSATEIYGYGYMEKVVSPFLKEAFYKTTYIPEAVESIGLDDVMIAAGRRIPLPATPAS